MSAQEIADDKNSNLSGRYRHSHRLPSKHRLIPVGDEIAEKFSRLMAKYASQKIRKADALIAATCWAKKLPLVTRNVKHYRFIKEISLLEI